MGNKDIKSAIRKERLALRDALPVEKRIEDSLWIADCAASKLEFHAGTIISAFLPIRSEVDVRPLMVKLRARGARLCVPAIIDKETIEFRELKPDTELVDSGFGTAAPGPDAAVLDPDIMLVPLAVFDPRGHRIGYGAGYYDRAITRLRQKGLDPSLIGIAFDCQEVPEVPFEPHDVSLDAILTESGWRQISK